MKLIDSFLELLFPEHFTCDICGREIFDGANFCEECAKTVEANDKFTCSVCGRKTAADGICTECKSELPNFDRAVSAFVYNGGIAKLIPRFKNDKSYLKRFFGKNLAKACSPFTDADAICFVPMTSAATFMRGYNQSKLLADELSGYLHLPVLKKAIVKTRKTKSQKTLSRRERLKNLEGCFRADRQLVKDKIIILVDDVLTTGATADAVSVELKKKGAKKVYLATVASVEHKING